MEGVIKDDFRSKLIDNKKLSFQAFVPRPPEEDDNWYEWNVEHWGTKWDVAYEDDLEVEEDDNKMVFSFHTAWSPCIPFVKTLSTMYPDLTFTLRYYELDNMFAGFVVYKKGVFRKGKEIEDEQEARQFVIDHFHFDPFQKFGEG